MSLLPPSAPVATVAKRNLHDEKVVFDWTSQAKSLPSASPLLSLAAFGMVDDALELWHQDGGDRELLLRVVETAGRAEQWECAVAFAALMTNAERLKLLSRAHCVPGPVVPARLCEIVNAGYKL